MPFTRAARLHSARLQPALSLLLILLIAAVLLVLFPNRIQGTDPQEEVLVSRVKALFARNCQSCHGKDGRGTRLRQHAPSAPDFTNSSWQDARSNTQILVTILEGKGNEMPSFNEHLSRNEVRDLVGFIRRMGPDEMTSPAHRTREFEKRFRELEEELRDLRRQFQDASGLFR
jgi:mono/diheme cytochrome c family protein